MNFRIIVMLLLGSSINQILAMENADSSQVPTTLTKQLKNHGLHLKLTQPPCIDDCLFLAENLHQVNQEKTEQYFTATLKSPLSDKPVGEIYQHSLEIVNIEVLEKIMGNTDSETAFQKANDLVNSLLQKAHEMGATRAFSSCSSQSKLVQLFVNAGFQVSAELPHLEKNGLSICFFKDIDLKMAPIKNHIEITSQKEGEASEGTCDEAKIKEFKADVLKIPNLFGIFLYDNQKIRGGVWGGISTLEDEDFVGTSHSHINILWVDKSMNGRGLGTILMGEAEDFAIKKGAKYLQLETNGFQAPGFYQKLGFSLSEIRPNDFVVDGKPSSLYVCTKKLFENPLQDRGLKPYSNTLCGARFFLRPIFPADYTAFLPVFTDPMQMKYLGYGNPITMEKAQEYTENGARENNKTKPLCFSWAIITHQGIAGRVFITNTTEESLEKEFAYFICPAFAGRGLATDASSLAMDSLEGPFMATVHPDNIGSRIVLIKLGCRADPTRMGVPKYGSVRDYYLLPDKKDASGSLGDLLSYFNFAFNI